MKRADSCGAKPALAILALCVLVAGCGSSPTSPSNNAPYSQTDVQVGTGATAANNNVLMVHYTGWFYSESQTDHKGPQFETSRGSTAVSFTLGIGQVIRGWDQGVVGMRVGGIRRLVIPPSLAYGTARNGIIPPNATLVFDIELLDVQ